MRLIFILVFLCIYSFCQGQNIPEIHYLKNWKLINSNHSIQLNIELPGEVHDYLHQADMIPDPILSVNESKVQWVAEQEWIFETEFTFQSEKKKASHVFLCLDKIDGIAEVYLNNHLVLKSENSFINHSIPVHDYLIDGNNKLIIKFLPISNWLNQKAGELPYILSHENRVFARKPQYQFGWDWGPKLICVGIYALPTLNIIKEKSPAIALPTLPAAHLEQNADKWGESFRFIDNKTQIPFFVKGANWIPPSSTYPVDCQKYENLIADAASVGINMLRVWGGGHYEADCFYELCNKYNILVWQDFMFACAMYPGDAAFLQSVQTEAEQQVKRLSRFENVVLFCGNNEVDEGWKNWGWQKQYGLTPQDSAKIYENYEKIFKTILPEAVAKYGNHRSYIHTSPLFGWGRKESMTHGDSHYWGVWWGLEPLEKYKEKVPRFMSEYGMQAFPHPYTLQDMNAGRMPQDTTEEVMRAHQKHPTGYKSLNHYISNNYEPSKNLVEYVYQSQLTQAGALEIAIESQRKAMPYCMGSMYWQLNDCWPVVSWSTVDYYGRWKAAMYKLKELYAPLLSIAEYVDSSISLTVSADKLVDLDGVMEMEIYNFHDAEPIFYKTIELKIQSKNGKFETTIPKEELKKIGFNPQKYYLKTIVRTSELKKYTRNHFLVKPNHLHLAEPEISYRILNDELIIKAKKFAKNIWIQEFDYDNENFFDLMPGEEKRMKMSSIPSGSYTIFHE
jgi:beta-mannosidase